VNELGVEEAGIDGGGIFKDFMEKITRAAFDVQYGLFKVICLVLLTQVFVDLIIYLTPSSLHLVRLSFSEYCTCFLSGDR
jgi:hypothetical protein